MLYFLYLFVIMLFFLSYIICNRDILAPAVLTCIMYIISIMFAMINIKAWNIEYQTKTCIIMIIGIISFIIPSILYYKKSNTLNYKENLEDKPLKVITTDNKIIYILLVLDVIITIFYIIDVYKISLIAGNNLGILGMSYYYRTYTAMNSDVETLSTIMNQFLKIGRSLGFVAIFIFSYNTIIDKDFKKHKIYLCFVVLTALQNLIGGGRGYILWLIGTGFATMYFTNMKIYNWKKIVAFKYIKKGMIILIIALIGFYFLKYLVRIGNTVNSMVDYISYYAGGSIQNFNLYIQDPPTGTHKIIGQESFIGLNKTLDKLGIIDISDVYINNSNLEFRNNGNISTGNVYGAIRRYYNDFGLLGVIILQLLCSLFYNSYYYKIKKMPNQKCHWHILFYSYLLYHIYEMPIDDTFYRSYISFNMITTFIILYFVYCLMTKIKIKGSKIKFKNNEGNDEEVFL